MTKKEVIEWLETKLEAITKDKEKIRNGIREELELEEPDIIEYYHENLELRVQYETYGLIADVVSDIKEETDSDHAKKVEQILSDIRKEHSIIGADGNWNSGPYMCGKFNGLELALSLAECRQPKYRALTVMEETSN